MEINVANIPDMYCKMMEVVSKHGVESNSRNGPVLTVPEPVMVHVLNPLQRVLHDPIRCANPFFHVMEFVWMMSGSNDPEWISQFNSRFVDYADTNTFHGEPRIHGAYGNRWLHHFCLDQISKAVDMLRDDPLTRRVVLGMWDPETDLGTNHNDLPCNTHIYFSVKTGALDMMVCNRSNDVIWGMTGANAVHMTMLQELIARVLGLYIGGYTVVTNNAHVYKDLPNVDKMLSTLKPVYPYDTHPSWTPHGYVSLARTGDSVREFTQECRDFMGGSSNFENQWLHTVALPMRDMYLQRKETGKWTKYHIADSNWRIACERWLGWKAQ